MLNDAKQTGLPQSYHPYAAKEKSVSKKTFDILWYARVLISLPTKSWGGGNPT